MPNKNQKTLLPFASYTETGNQPLKNAVEQATIFCIAELDREKGKGIFKKQPSESIVFVTKVHYPFWIAPLKNLALLFDGLDISSHTITYPAIPDPQDFIDNMSQRSSTCEVYLNFLSNSIDYFRASNGEKNEIVEGLISDAEFLGEFLKYLKEAKTVDAPIVDSVIVSSAHDEKRIKTNLKELENAYSKICQELAALNEIITIVNKRTQEALGTLREEIKETQEKFSAQIEKAKKDMEKGKLRIVNEYNDKVTEATNRYEQEVLRHRKELIKFEKTKEEITSEIERVETEIKTAAVNKDENAEQKLKEKRNELKQALPDILSTIKSLETKILEIEENKRKEFFQLKQENEDQLKEVGKDLKEIESSRDAEVKIAQDEMEKIDEMSSIIIRKVDQLAKMRETVVTEFDRLGIKQEKVELTLVYMPFYLICYQAGPKRRYTYVAPSVLTNGGLGLRLKAMGNRRITKMLQPRSQKILSILNSFLKLLDENVVFSHEITEACKKANMLESKESVALIKRGLSELEIEGWLSSSTYESFTKIVTQLGSP